MDLTRRCAALVAHSVLLVAIVSASATATHEAPANFDNEFRVLEGPNVDAEEVEGVLESDRGVNLDNATVKGDVELHVSQIESFIAHRTVFMGNLDVNQCVEGECDPALRTNLDFVDSQFLGRVDFSAISLAEQSKLAYKDCQFKQETDFHSMSGPELLLDGSFFDVGAHFVAMQVGYLSLNDVYFKGPADFASAQIKDIQTYRLRADKPVYIRWSQLGGSGWVDRQVKLLAPDLPDEVTRDEATKQRWPQLEAQLLFWKSNFVGLGYQRDAREVNREIITNRRELGLMGPGEWLVTRILGPASEFGTRPYRPFFIGLIVVPLFWLAYWWGDRCEVFHPTKDPPFRDKRPLSLFSLLYSIDTFIPFVAVTGVKDWDWATKGWSYWILELPERIVGFYLFSAAAYSITAYVI